MTDFVVAFFYYYYVWPGMPPCFFGVFAKYNLKYILLFLIVVKICFGEVVERFNTRNREV